MAFSTARKEQAVQNAAQLGLLLLLLSCALGFFAVSFFVRLILRPLREARDLAREIASGQLERRLPVRSADELGDLAISMNTMAGALDAARSAAESEAAALRTASSAMLSIAAGARDAQEPQRLFAMVARELKLVTRARAVALAVPAENGQAPAFAHFDPPAPWGGLVAGRPVPDSLVRRLAGIEDEALRLDTAGGLCECEAMAADGFRAVLLVPLHLPDSPPAVLLAAADDPAAFPAPERDLVLALTSHLSSALRAGRLQTRLEEAFEELQRTHDYLVQSEMLRVAGEMAAGVAHDFNNVLGAILGRTQLLHRQIEAGELSAQALRTSLAVIERAAQDGRETGRRLRQFGHVAQGSMAESVELPSVLHDAVEFTRPRWQNEAQAAGVGIEVHLDAEPDTWVAGRASELREVFTNLLLNSVDALPAGGAIPSPGGPTTPTSSSSSPTTGSAWTRRRRGGCSSPSSPPRATTAPGSAFPSSTASCSATAARSRSRPGPAPARAWRCGCPAPPRRCCRCPRPAPPRRCPSWTCWSWTTTRPCATCCATPPPRSASGSPPAARAPRRWRRSGRARSSSCSPTSACRS